MNRLQVGDECYVRSGKVIYKCEYIGECYGLEHAAAIANKRGCWFDITKSSPVKLVYPFPCVKELAQ